MAVAYLEDMKDFEDKVKKAAADKVVAIDFTATWCGPCKQIGPVFEALSQEFTNIQCFKVDVDENSEVSEGEGISAMPTFKFYKNGAEVEQMVGASKDKLKELFEKYN